MSIRLASSLLACIVSAGAQAAQPLAKERVEFASRPTAKADGANVRIEFEASRATDVAVEVFDEKGAVVRHLAAGMLGPHAPEPLARDSLKQSLVWDRTDDDGQPVAVACKARVGLGLRVKKAGMHATFGWRSVTPMPGQPPEPRNVAMPRDMVAGADGNIYLVAGYIWNSEKPLFPHVIVLDAEGNYIREIYPPPASAIPERTPGLTLLKLADGGLVPRIETDRVMFHGRLCFARRALITPSGRQLLVLSGDRYMTRLGTDGSVPAGGPVRLPPGRRVTMGGEQMWSSGVCEMSAALSPDGTILYVVGTEDSAGKGKAVIHTLPLDAEAAPTVFLAGDLVQPAGLAADSRGNLYVADRGRDRLVVVKPDGAVLKEIEFEKPFAVQIGPKGEVYVLQADDNGRWAGSALPRRLAKLAPDGTEAASFPLKMVTPVLKGERQGQPMAFFGMLVTVKDGKPVVWVGAQGPIPGMYGNCFAIQRVLDDGEKLVDAGCLDLNAKCYVEAQRIQGQEIRAEQQARWAGKQGAHVVQRDGHRYGLEFVKDNLPWKAIHVGLLKRFDAQWKEAPFPQAGDKKWLDIPYINGCRTNGGVFMNYQNELMVEVFKPSPKGKGDAVAEPPNTPLNGVDKLCSDGHVEYDYIHGLDQYGSGSRVFKVDRKGSVYVNSHLLPVGRFAPAELEAALGGVGSGKTEPYSSACGSIIKFSPKGGGFAWDGTGARIKDPAPVKDDLVRNPTVVWDTRKGRWRAACQGVEWQFIGLSPYISGWYGSCMCCAGNFDMDGHARVYVPDAYRMCVQVLDTNGNLLLRFGQYGNQDDAMRGIAFARPRVTRVDGGQLCVDDPQNGMTTRLEMAYAAEETVAVP